MTQKTQPNYTFALTVVIIVCFLIGFVTTMNNSMIGFCKTRDNSLIPHFMELMPCQFPLLL